MTKPFQPDFDEMRIEPPFGRVSLKYAIKYAMGEDALQRVMAYFREGNVTSSFPTLQEFLAVAQVPDTDNAREIWSMIKVEWHQWKNKSM